MNTNQNNHENNDNEKPKQISRNNLTYRRVGDYYLPNLIALEAPRIGKYGTMRFQYLRDHRKYLFSVMLLNGILNAHLEEIDRQAHEMLERLTNQMVAREGVTEQLKADNPMTWVGCMNNIKARAEEIVYNELIYQ